MIKERIVFKGTQDFVYKLNKRFIGSECAVRLIDGNSIRGELSLIVRGETFLDVKNPLADGKEDMGTVCFDNFDIKHIIIFKEAAMIDFINLRR